MHKKLFVYIVLVLFAFPLYASADNTTTCSYDYFAQKVVCTTTPDFQQQQEQKRREAQSKLDSLKAQYGVSKYYACLPPSNSMSSDPYVMETAYQQTKYCLERQVITSPRPVAPSPASDPSVPPAVPKQPDMTSCWVSRQIKFQSSCKTRDQICQIVYGPQSAFNEAKRIGTVTTEGGELVACGCVVGSMPNGTNSACVLSTVSKATPPVQSPNKQVQPNPLPLPVQPQPKVESAQDAQPSNELATDDQSLIEEKMQVLPQVAQQDVVQAPVEKPGVFKRFWRWVKKLF